MEKEEDYRALIEQLRLLVDNSSDVITLLNKDGKYIYVSESVTRVTGHTPFELIGKSFDSAAIHPDDLPDVKMALNLIEKQPGVQIRMTYRHSDNNGGYRYMETIGENFIDNPGINGILLSSRDCSEMRCEIDNLRDLTESLIHKNQALLEKNDELTLHIVDIEAKIREYTDDLEDKTDEIQQLLKQKDEFIYQLAHDLRTPLTPVVAMLPLLKAGIQDHDAKALLDIFNKSIQYLQKMVENIIYYSQLNKQYSIT
ncbi:MAG TPA: PAS domain S-box protein, partial [Methanospirillum sp.]|uniref:PAS domain S-box protein n=1 Tax=Methanospirillum sp. TaxID=45200 RepID=UPI002BF907CF